MIVMEFVVWCKYEFIYIYVFEVFGLIILFELVVIVVIWGGLVYKWDEEILDVFDLLLM